METEGIIADGIFPQENAICSDLEKTASKSENAVAS
jgi:hypothetical protein